jgi:hypothetical protein
LLTPRIVDTLLPHCHVPLKGHGIEADFQIFYLMLIFSDFAADHGLINYIETKAKVCHLKKFACKGTLRQVFIRVYRQINTCRKVPLQVNFLDDNILPFCFGVYIVSWSMLHTFPSSKDGQIQINTDDLYKIFTNSPTQRVGESLRFKNNLLTVGRLCFASKIIFLLSNVLALLRK